MTEYIFFFWNKNKNLDNQFIFSTDSPEEEGHRLLELSNIKNSLKSKNFSYVNIKEWNDCLRSKGKDYV